MFTFKMVLADGSPADPPQFVSSVPNWKVGDVAMIRPGFKYRIVRIDHNEPEQPVWRVMQLPPVTYVRRQPPDPRGFGRAWTDVVEK